MTTIEQIRTEREAREADAQRIAATLPPGDYHAYSNTVVDSNSRETVASVASHWDACLILLAIGKG